MPNNSIPLFSIVIPTYNHGHLISKCLDSIIAQTYTNWEAIVINNFSTDNTIEIVESYKDPRIILINFSNNGIIAASRNVGIRNSNAEWLCFLDSDDFWYETKLAETIPFLESFDFVYHDMNVYKNDKLYTNKKIKMSRSIGKDSFLDMLLYRNPIIASSVIVRSAMVKKAGNFSENADIVTLEDFDLWLRLAQINCRFYFNPKPLGAYFIGNSNQSKPSIKRLEREEAFYAIHLYDIDKELKYSIITNMAYAHGRICQLAGEFSLGISYYKKALLSKRISIRIKSFIFIIVLSIEIFFGHMLTKIKNIYLYNLLLL